MEEESINSSTPTESRKQNLTQKSNGITYQPIKIQQTRNCNGMDPAGSVVERWPEDITSVPTKESNAEAKIIKRVLTVSVENTNEIDQNLHKHDLWKTLRISAWIWRFAFNCRGTCLKLKGSLKSNEIERQKLLWVK